MLTLTRRDSDRGGGAAFLPAACSCEQAVQAFGLPFVGARRISSLVEGQQEQPDKCQEPAAVLQPGGLGRREVELLQEEPDIQGCSTQPATCSVISASSKARSLRPNSSKPTTRTRWPSHR
ncbi:hypothetical protein ABGB12_12675 [Actinocorallia sp. B10E7]|uniref:hypothetical protein n=1 Tax=Actinocorallia sp. B10E7 TaxID=3153558 RepID=UPI00325C920E